MFGKPCAKLPRKLLQNFGHSIPVYKVKVLRGYKTFAFERRFGHIVGVVVMEGFSSRANEFLTVDIDPNIFKWEVTGYIIPSGNCINQCIFCKCITSAVELLR